MVRSPWPPVTVNVVPTASDPAATSRGWWKCRALDTSGQVLWLAHVRGGLHADDVYLDLPEAEATAAVADDAVCVAHYSGDEVSRLEVTPTGAPKATQLWFAEIDDRAATPRAVVLMAFTGHSVPPGSLLDDEELRLIDVVSSDQLAALRWYHGTGEVDQVYVSPTRRREGIGSALIMAGGTLAVARGWSRLWGDGQRTALGDRWRSTSDWAHRTSPLSHLSPPMTPDDPR